MSPSFSIPFFNLGLREKHLSQWQRSLKHNQHAVELNAEDQSAWWNLGIAATALHDWDEAARAWKKCGLETVEIRDGELYAPCGKSCVRVDPRGKYPEVLWGYRLDPARIRIENVPLPRSKRRYGDIVLNDGSGEGTRISDGEEYPVFDELEIWQTSSYSTFSAAVRLGTADSEMELEKICRSFDVAIEDWGTVRLLCETCSRGNPGEHICAERADATGDKNFGFAAASRQALLDVLRQWKSTCPATDYSEPRLELLAAMP